MKGRRISEETKQYVLALSKQGFTIAKIAEMAGISKDSVKWIRRQAKGKAINRFPIELAGEWDAVTQDILRKGGAL